MRRSDISWSFCGATCGARVRVTDNDRWFLIESYRWFSSILQTPQQLRVSNRQSTLACRHRGRAGGVASDFEFCGRRLSICLMPGVLAANVITATLGSAIASLHRLVKVFLRGAMAK
jgi:hypothetical protein